MEEYNNFFKKYIDKKLLKTTFFIAFGNVSSQILTVVFWIITAWTLIPDDYGALRYAITIATFISIPATSGYPNALTRYLGKYKDNEEKANAYLTNVLYLETILMTLIIIATIIASFLIPDKINIFIVLIVFSLAFYYLYFGIVRGLLLHKMIVGYGVVVSLLRIVFALLVYYLKFPNPLISVIILFSLSSFISVPLMIFLGKLKIKIKKEYISKEIIKELTSFSNAYIISTIAWTIILNIDIVFVEYYLGLTTVAIFSVAKTISRVFMLIPNAIMTIHLPKTAGIKNNIEVIGETKKSLLLQISSSAILLILIFFFGSFIINLLFPEKYSKAVEPLLILSISAVLTGIFGIIGTTWSGIGKPIVETKILTIGAILTIILNYYFLTVLNYGMVGVAIAGLISIGIALLILAFITLKSIIKIL